MHDAELRVDTDACLYDQAMRARRTPNPFYFGDLALDEAFTDREAELKSLKSDIL